MWRAPLLVAALGLGACAGEEVAANCRAADTAGTKAGDAGVVLIQRSSASSGLQKAGSVPAAAPSADFDTATAKALSELQSQVATLTKLVREMKRTMVGVAKCCNSSCSGPTPPPPNTTVDTGLCAAFGDPHFTTFDGGHTILQRTATLWLVKSDNIWIQALSKTGTGNLMGVAVGGPFLNGHTFVFANATLSGGEPGTLSALLDGVPILTSVDSAGKANFNEPYLLWGARRPDWVPGVHDKQILQMPDPIHFDVGPWQGRFQNKPEGGVWLFRFPQGVQITATGVDYMSAVIRMAKQPGGQTGYCGNFNGNADDDFEPAAVGSVPANLLPAWNIPEGEDLAEVADAQNLFLVSSATKSFVAGFLQEERRRASLAQTQQESPAGHCEDPDFMQKAEAACDGLPGEMRHAECLIDVCLTGDLGAAGGVASAGILQEVTNAQNIPTFVGHGRCRDAQGHLFRGIRSTVRSKDRCQQLLKQAANTPGVVGLRGAQLRVLGRCELLVDVATDVGALKALVVPRFGGWAGDRFTTPAPAAAPTGDGAVSGVESDLGWSCWRLN